MMKLKYFDFDGTYVASIGKVGSSAIARALVLKLKPHYKIVSVSGNKEAEKQAWSVPGWQHGAPVVESPDEAIIPVRDPVERFRSACAQEGREDVDAVIDELLEDGKFSDGLHFAKQASYLVASNTLYRFPSHVAELAAALGLESLPVVNEGAGGRKKPDLTKEQRKRVEEIYAEDILLFDSITTAGQTG